MQLYLKIYLENNSESKEQEAFSNGMFLWNQRLQLQEYV